MIEKFDFAIGLFRKKLSPALPLAGPFIGIEYCAPLLPYQIALVIGF